VILETGVGKSTDMSYLQWNAYPYLPPTTTFPPVKLGDGFYYVNSFEPFVISDILVMLALLIHQP